MATNNLTYIAVAAFIAVFIVGVGAGAVVFANNTPSTSSEPFHLTLVVTDNNTYNSTVGSQPMFFVLQNGVLTSSANISVPVNKKIELTIMNYDDGADNMSDATLGKVITGTGNNSMLLITDDTMNASQDKNGLELNAEALYVSSVPLDDMSHTFTVLSADLHSKQVNIPIEPSSTITTTIQFSTTGTFHWQCYVPCGSGSSGWSGAMNTPGWMEGSVIVS